MSRNKIAASALAICAGLALAGTATAACVQADAAGSWQAYSISSEGMATRCKLSINSAGLMSSTTCTSYFGSSNLTGTLTNGKVTLSAGSTCSFTASFKLAGTVNTVRHLTLSKDKTTGDGIGTFPNGSFSFTLNKL